MSDYTQEITALLRPAAKAFAEKNYELAVELYSEACETSNFETGKDNPDLLFLYGKSLFENAVSKNGVLGATENDSNRQATSSKEDEDQEKSEDKGMFQFNDRLAEDDDDDDDDRTAGPPIAEEEDDDENDHPQQQNNLETEADEEQTDFEVAWEILDLTRTIYEEQLDQLKNEDTEFTKPYLKSDKRDAMKGVKSPFILLKKKLSDVFDLLGDISLETENFKQATLDFQSLVNLRIELYPFSSGLVTESYYKLSLALEFYTDDLQSLPKAIKAMEETVKSIKQRAVLPDENVDEDLINEMELRYLELKKGDDKIKEEKEKIMKGLLGEITSSDSKLTSSTSAPVNDLTSMVKKRKPKTSTGKMIRKKVKKA